MATSGSIKTSTYTWTASDGNKKSIYYTVDWTRESYSIVDNTSTVKFTIKAVKSSSTYGVNEKKVKLTLDGEQIFYRGGVVSRKASATVGEVTQVINHNADGNKSFVLYFELCVGGSDNPNKTVSGTFDLDWIPRNTPIGGYTAELVVNGTNKSRVTFSPYVSTYTHKITWSIGSYSNSATLAAGVTSAEYAIPKSWLAAIPSAQSGTAKITLQTFSGTTQIGVNTEQTFIIKCAGDEKPNFNYAVSDANGIYNKIDAYVINQSKFKVDLSGITYQYGTSLKSVSVTIGKTTYTGTATSVTAQTNIDAASTVITVALTDARGYSTTKTQTITAYTYANPSLSLDISRYASQGVKDDEGGLGLVSYKTTISKIGTNAVQSVKIEWAATDGTGAGNVTKTAEQDSYYATCDTEKVFNFTVTVTDKLTTVVYKKQLSSAVTIMDILKGGTGVCIGGVATKPDTLEVMWSILPRLGIRYLFNDTAADNEKALMRAKLDLLPESDGFYPISGGWVGKKFGFTLGMVVVAGSYIRKFAVMVLEDGRILLGYSKGNGDNDYSVFSFSGTKL